MRGASSVESDQEGFVRLIQAAMIAQVREASIALETQQDRLIDRAEKVMCDAELGVTRLLETITQKTQIQLESERSEIERLAHTVTLKAQTRLDAAVLDLDQIGCDRAGARDYAAFLGFFSLDPP